MITDFKILNQIATIGTVIFKKIAKIIYIMYMMNLSKSKNSPYVYIRCVFIIVVIFPKMANLG